MYRSFRIIISGTNAIVKEKKRKRKEKARKKKNEI